MHDIVAGGVPSGSSHGDLGDRARTAAVWALLDRWLTRLLTTIVFIILARLLRPYEFGIVALALVVRNFLGVFIDQGFSEAVVQRPELERRYIDTAFWTAMATGSLLMLITIAAAPFIASAVLGNPSITPLLRVLAVSLLFTALSCTQSALLQRDLAFRELAIRRVVAQLVAGTAAVAAAFLGAGAWSIVLQTLLQGGIGAAILWRYSRWRPTLEFDAAAFRSLFAFGISMIGIDVLYVLQQQADNFLIGRTLGAAALGIYALAFRFYYVIVDITMSSMSGVALSTFARVQQDLAATRRVFLTATRLTSLIALPFFAGMAIVAPEMISGLVGNKWAESAPVLRALCPSGLILCLSYLDRSLIVALGRPRLALGLSAVGVGLRVVGYIVGVQFGVVGVAVGLSVTSLIFWPCRLVVVRRVTGLSLGRYARQLSSAAIATSAMLSVLLLARWASYDDPSAMTQLVGGVLIGGAVYGIALAVIDRPSFVELIGLARTFVSSLTNGGRMTGSDQRTQSSFLRKIRQNWHWGRTHGWRDLIEEHDISPLVRGRRALRKAQWRRSTKPDRHSQSTPVFLVGAQRSGTNMMAHGLDEAPEFQVFNEGNARAFDNYRLRDLSTIQSLIDRSAARFVLFKPLCDSHRAQELLDHFDPRGRVLWAYREVDGRVRSAVAKFGDSNLRVLRACAAGNADDAWQVQGISSENGDFIRSFDFERLSEESAAALFWYIRNSLYFELSLDQRRDAMLVSYDRFVSDPESIARALCVFLGLDYRHELIAHIRRRPQSRSRPVQIDARIRQRCTELQHRLDTVSAQQISGPAIQ
jgi:O-antigen/teichoic acid export membrane protein